VRWKGFGEDEDTWEPEENLFDCKNVLDEYWEKSRKNKQTKVEKIGLCLSFLVEPLLFGICFQIISYT
jgi:hypothetical protein